MISGYMKRHIMALAVKTVSLFAVAFMASCASGDLDERPEHGHDIYLTVVVNPVGNSAISPTRSGDSGLPKYERLTTLRVIIVNTDNDNKIVEANRQVRYNADGILIGDNLTFKVKPGKKMIYLFGNEANMPQEFVEKLEKFTIRSTFSDLSEEIISRQADKPLYMWADDNINGGLPMSECFEYTVRNAQTEADLYQTVKMFVTRTACKFTFNIKKAPGYEPADVERGIRSICLTGIGTREYLLPKGTVYNPGKYEPNTNENGSREITAFDVPETDNAPERFVFNLPDEVYIGRLGDAGYTYSPAMYFPESKGEVLPGETFDRGFMCSISYDGEKYLPFQTLQLTSLPRNTHVIVNIEVSHSGLLLNVETLPWDTESFEFDFSKNIGIPEDGVLSFTGGTYAALYKDTGRLILNDYPQATAGSFHIATPVGTRWDAFLVTQTGEQNAIQFQVADGEGAITTSDHITGIVGTRTEFKVVATSAAGSVARSARMQVVVTMPNGMSIPADILPQDFGDGVKNIVFVQNPQ